MSLEDGVDVESMVGEVLDSAASGAEVVKDKVTEGYDKAKEVVTEVKYQVETFRASVQQKSQCEEKREGWKSSAFDF